MPFKSWLSSVLQPRRRSIRCARKVPHRVRLAVEALEDRTVPATLGTYSAVEGPALGSASVVLAETGVWTAKSNDPFLHLAAGSLSGLGNAVIQFTFDANNSVTRSGTLTIAGETFTVTQAGSTYVAANPLTSLVSTGLGGPNGVAVDAAGNVYIADTTDNAIKVWSAATQQISTLVSEGLSVPTGVAVDAAGNVYIADTYNSAIKVWNAGTQEVSTLVSSGLSGPTGVAVDGAGNVYIADINNSAIKMWSAATHEVSTLFTSQGGSFGVAVDAAGNVYFDDSAIKMWSAATHQVSTLVSSGLNFPTGMAVDGAGNVFFADASENVIKEWNAATGMVSTLVSSGLKGPTGVAVDTAGNVYIADAGHNAVKTLTRAFVPGDPVSEGTAPGSDHLLPVLPVGQLLTGLFAPSSDQSWLTLDASADGVVNFSFATNTGPARTAHITVLGQSIPVTQAAPIAPSLAWSNPADITYGTALGATQLDATADVAGTFTYTPAAGTVLNAGPSQSLSVLFTPDDTVHYTTATMTVPINVLKATPTVTATGGTFTYDGIAHLASAVVTGVGGATVLGGLTFTYNGSATAPTKAGTYAVVATFTSIDPNYTGATGSATLTILSAKKQIVLIINQINALVSSNQLNRYRGNVLLINLNMAIARLDSGNTTRAITQLSRFILKVKDYKKSGQVKRDVAQLLIDAARKAISSVQQGGNGTAAVSPGLIATSKG